MEEVTRAAGNGKGGWNTKHEMYQNTRLSKTYTVPMTMKHAYYTHMNYGRRIKSPFNIQRGGCQSFTYSDTWCANLRVVCMSHLELTLVQGF